MNKNKKKVTDVKITSIIGIPRTNLQDWKNSDVSGWRYKVYHYLKSKSEEELQDFANSLNASFTEQKEK